MVQFPGRKIRWATLLQSVEGAGKTFLAQALKAILGTEHVRVIDGAAIHKGWSEWAWGASVIILEEVQVAGTNKYEVMNCLKPLITNDEIAINERNRNTRQAPNTANYLLFSNFHTALALTPGDRRYFVIKSPLQTKEHVKALGDAYFPPLYKMLRENAGGLRSFFMDWEISPDFKADGPAPVTTYVTELVQDSFSELHSAIRRLLAENDYPLIAPDLVSSKSLADVLHLEEGHTRVTAQHIAHVLREEGFRQLGRYFIGGEQERHYLWHRGPCVEDPAKLAADRLKTGRNRDAAPSDDPAFF